MTLTDHGRGDDTQSDTASRASLLEAAPAEDLSAARSLAFSLGFEFVDLNELELTPAAKTLISDQLARREHVVPIGVRRGRPTIAVGVPTDFRTLENIRAAIGDDFDMFAAERAQVDRYVEQIYGQPTSIAARDGSSSSTDTLVPRSSRRASLESILVTSGLLTREQAEAALGQQASSGRSLRDIVAGLGLVSELDLLRALAQEAGFELVDLNKWSVEPQAAELIPESIARRHHVLGIGFSQERPVVAISDPSNVVALDDVRALLGREIEIVVCLRNQIDECILRTYSHNAEADIAATSAALNTAAGDATPVADLNDLHVVVEDAPIVQFVNLILRQALNERASDVHIEPTAGNLQVRFRIDGVLHQVTTVPKAIQGGVTTRLKVMANLDIAEHRVPQDGRISISAGNRDIDMRVATLPTVNGEKVVLRVLDRSTAPLDLDKLGFDPDVLARYASAYRKPSGTILVTGPTGSGKSTTLYATLNKLNSRERNLITVEDPAEYQLEGINQVQVNPKAGLNFANALRAILRSDPDVLLIGEIRDRETATIAVEAALTGHLVLSCLHTNAAASTPMRLIEMGVEPFLVCSSLDCVLAQRLARILCPSCSETYQPTMNELRAAGWHEGIASEGEPVRFRRPVGCQACGRTGYRGRVAIQEVMLLSESIERAVLARAHTDEVQRVAVAEGMRPMRFDGLRKAALGITSLEEIVRVIT